MTDTVTISRECAKWLAQFVRSNRRTLYYWEEDQPLQLIELERAITSPPPPSGLREALRHLIEIGTQIYNTGIIDHRLYPTFAGALGEASVAVVASPDDDWVQVDEEHPLPSDLRKGDEVALKIQQRLVDEQDKHSYKVHSFTLHPENAVAYRRHSGQGG